MISGRRVIGLMLGESGDALDRGVVQLVVRACVVVRRQSLVVPADHFLRLDSLWRRDELWSGEELKSIVVRALVLLSLVLAKHLNLRLHTQQRTNELYINQT